MMDKILVINGPNLNFLGIRETKVYGTESYNTLIQKIQKKAGELGLEAECWQSNHEGAISRCAEKCVCDKGGSAYQRYSVEGGIPQYQRDRACLRSADIRTRAGRISRSNGIYRQNSSRCSTKMKFFRGAAAADAQKRIDISRDFR